MIDKNSEHILRKLGKQADAEMKKTLKIERPMEGQKDQMLWTLKKLEEDNGDGSDKKTNAKAAHAIRKMLASGEYDKVNEVIDEAHLDKFWTKKVNKLIKQGRVKKFDPNDPFIRKLRKKRNAQAQKKSPPSTS